MSKMYDVIQELCRRNKTDVTKMCRALGIPRSTLSELATGRTRQLSLKHAQPIADYFGVGTAALLGGEATDGAGQRGAIAEFLDLYGRLSPEDKAALRDYMRKLLESGD